MISKPFQIVCVLCHIFLQKSYFSHATINEKKIKRNDAIQGNIPFEWSNLKFSEPGFDLSPDEMAKFNIWPTGLIPFYIDSFSFDSVLCDRLRSYLAEVAGVTGVEFEELPLPPQDEHYRYVFFVNRRGTLGCVDYTNKDFTNHGVQKVVLGYDCFSGAMMGSLILALLGVPPQHNSPDRDDHIEIHEDNILADKKRLFKKLSNDEWLFHNIDYDIASAGHYDSHKYSRNGAATIVMIKNSSENFLGDRNGLTYTDLWKVRMLYNRITRKRNFKQKSGSAKNVCSKIFKPGKYFDKIKPRKGTTLKEDSRPRPLQYSDNQTIRNGFFIPQYDKIKTYLKGRNQDNMPLQFRVAGRDPLHDQSDFISDTERK